MNIQTIFIVLALVSFSIAAIGVPVARVNLVALGLAFYMAALLIR